MNKEALPQLSPDAQAHIENFPPDLHTVAQDRLLSLSHNELHTRGIFDELLPIQQTELGEQHQPYIDTVTEQMGRASQLLSSAHAELESSGTNAQEISFETLAEKAKEIAIQSAKEAKARGESEAAVKSLESLLVIESLSSSGDSYQTEQPQVRTLRKIVSEGLANELVRATHETFGLVAVQKYQEVPLNDLARSNSQLLTAATSLEFSDDFSDIAPSESNDDLRDLKDLSCGDLLALSKASESEQTNTSVTKELLRKALGNTETGLVEPEELAETLARASDYGLLEEIGNTLNRLRLRRRSGDSTYRMNDPDTGRLDETIVRLVISGRPELAKALISSSSSEIKHLEFTVRRLTSEDTGQQTLATLEGLRKEKQAELRQQLQSNGASEPIVEWIINSTADPDSSVDIAPEFWQKVETNTSLIELLENNGGDLSRTAEAISTIEYAGLTEYARELLRKVVRIDDPEKTQAYLISFKGALDILATLQVEGKLITDMKRIVSDLIEFEDPVAALKAAEKYYGDEYLAKTMSFRLLLERKYSSRLLIAFRPEDVDGLVVLRNYCENAGIDKDLIQGISSFIMSSNNPLERAHIIADALEIANTAAKDFFYEIVKREDPLALGRAAHTFEMQFSDQAPEFRHNLIRLIIGSLDPEATSDLIIKTSQQLCAQQIAIDDIDEKSFSEAMRIIKSDNDGEKFERFCSDWKIQRECEQAYIKYLQPVRESGSLKSLNPEQKPRLADLPEVKSRFKKLGIEPDLAESMLDSWLTYSALMCKLYARSEDELDDVMDKDIDSTLAAQVERLIEQLEALSSYVEQFGIGETKALIDTFGIYNFIRYKSDQLHNQLQNWQSEEMPAKNVVVSARSDWNGALLNVGKEFQRVFKDEGFFCFEVNDRVSLAKVAVAIGNREHAAGRDPETINALENFVIDAHANPTGLLLGTRGECLKTVDYSAEPLNGQKANTYRRHLGNRFRVILEACSTAAEVEYGKNLAESISDHHDVRVEGSKVNTRGSVIIEPDGTVRFNEGTILATIYE